MAAYLTPGETGVMYHQDVGYSRLIQTMSGGFQQEMLLSNAAFLKIVLLPCYTSCLSHVDPWTDGASQQPATQNLGAELHLLLLLDWPKSFLMQFVALKLEAAFH
jgi:hypothetical protein